MLNSLAEGSSRASAKVSLLVMISVDPIDQRKQASTRQLLMTKVNFRRNLETKRSWGRFNHS